MPDPGRRVGSTVALAFLAAGLALAVATAAALKTKRDREADALATRLTQGDPNRGPEIALQYGCAGCHTIPGVRGPGGKVGPPLADVGARHYPFLPVRALLRDRFPVRETVGTVSVPVHVVAGGADEVVPTVQSRAVAAAAGASYVEVPQARHNDPELGHGPLVVDAVMRASR